MREGEELYSGLGLDPEIVEGDYREAFQKIRQSFDNPKNIDRRFFLEQEEQNWNF